MFYACHKMKLNATMAIDHVHCFPLLFKRNNDFQISRNFFGVFIRLRFSSLRLKTLLVLMMWHTYTWTVKWTQISHKLFYSHKINHFARKLFGDHEMENFLRNSKWNEFMEKCRIKRFFAVCKMSHVTGCGR